ncbi:MAG: hypothetical protein ACOX3D_06285 [Syntrophomonadales bacterium]
MIDKFVEFVQEANGIADKGALSARAQHDFNLTRDRSVYYGEYFAVRFCSAGSRNFSNTVLSLSALQKYDKMPFIVCLVAPQENYLMLANSTFLRKISHSSQELRVDNIKGSFNGSDIMRDFMGVSNEPDNFEFLFTSHRNYTFEENLERLVEATNNIHPTSKRFSPTEKQLWCIRTSVERAISFLSSDEYKILNDDLQERVNAVASEIAIAAGIDNVNLRGRVIECLIASADDNMRTALIDALRSRSPLPEIYTADELGDYTREFYNFRTATDIKSKIRYLSSNPKGYNVDKLLSFLSQDNSVYLTYVVAIDANKKISTRLCSIFNRQILNGTRIIKHWAGRNSRGVAQYDGIALENVVSDFDISIDTSAAKCFIEYCLNS